MSAPLIREVSITSDIVAVIKSIHISKICKDSSLNPTNYSCVISYNIANADDNDDREMSLMDMVALVHQRKELKVGHRIPHVLDEELELEEEDSNQE